MESARRARRVYMASLPLDANVQFITVHGHETCPSLGGVDGSDVAFLFIMASCRVCPLSAMTYTARTMSQERGDLYAHCETIPVSTRNSCTPHYPRCWDQTRYAARSCALKQLPHAGGIAGVCQH